MQKLLYITNYNYEILIFLILKHEYQENKAQFQFIERIDRVIKDFNNFMKNSEKVKEKLIPSHRNEFLASKEKLIILWMKLETMNYFELNNCFQNCSEYKMINFLYQNPDHLDKKGIHLIFNVKIEDVRSKKHRFDQDKSIVQIL